MISTNTYDEAIAILMNGGVGVMPTDTVYGLVARAADKAAVARFYGLKKREHKPGTVVAASVQQLVELGVDERHLKQVEQWWPNSLSVETPLGGELAYLHQDTGRQALRVVADAQLRQVLEQTGPLVTSSANQPGEPGAVNLKQAQDYFNGKVDFYVEGGDLSGRAPSTIIRIVNDSIEVIRKGAIDIGAVKSVHASCPFCRSNGLLKGEIVYESDGAYLTQADSNEGNYLIIPSLHVELVDELPDNWWREVKALLRHVPDLAEDYNISVNVGRQAGQTVKHLHFWVISRSGDEPAAGKGFARLIKEANQVQ